MSSTTTTTTSKLLVRGSINIDEFFNVHHIVASGETISSTGYSRRAGGKGANQAVSTAKAGAQVDFAGLIGSDGEWLRESLTSYGVGIDLLKTDTSLPTGRAIIQLSDSTRDNSIVLLPGSNFSPSSPTIPNLSTYSHLLLQNEIPLTETRSILVKAHASGLTTIFNPSPMLTLSELEAFEWSSLDWLLVNEGEANELVKVLGTGKEEGSVLDRLRKVPVLSGLAGILMTKGGDGVAAAIGGPDGETVETGAGKVVGGVKDTTGAGDCFTGFFATLVSTAATPLTADALKSILLVASQAGAMCVEKEGAMESVPSLAEVKQRMEGGWPAGPWETLLA